LRRLCEAAGLTQEELASRAGLTAKAISMLERGERKRPYPRTVRSLVDALRLSEGEREVQEIVGFLGRATVRLLTLTGPGASARPAPGGPSEGAKIFPNLARSELLEGRHIPSKAALRNDLAA
jgi:transcriptional regulator with XRE-family HTH domain